MKLKVLIPLAATAALFAGCSPTPGTAASVGGETISVAEVNEMSEACIALGAGQDPRFTPQGIANAFIGAEFFDAMAGEIDQVTEMAAQIEAGVQQIRAADPACGEAATYISKSAAFSQLPIQPEQMEALYANYEVYYNPRYGRVGPDSGSLSVPSGQ